MHYVQLFFVLFFKIYSFFAAHFKYSQIILINQNFIIMTKKNCLFLVCLAMLTLGFFGCQKEQSELNIADSQYFSTIQGTLFYPAGVSQSDVGGTPVAGKTVFVDVPYSYYSSSATGTKRFTTTTNSQGKFSFTIPAKIASGAATLKVESFPGKHYIFDQDLEEFVPKNVIYKYGGMPVTVTASGLENKNLILYYDLVDLEVN